MAHYKEGDRSTCICETCVSVVTTTMRIRDITIGRRTIDQQDMIVEGILVGVCDQCGTIVSYLPQTTPAIKQALQGV